MNKINLSVVINTLNEERNIDNVLQSVVKWAGEIIIVDMHSTDDTIKIAKKFGAKIFHHERVGYVEPARSYAVEMASFEWVLILDADELVPSKLQNSIESAIESNECDVYLLPRLNYFFGKVVMHAGWGPDQDHQLRLFKKNTIIFSDEIHSRPEVIEGSLVKVMNSTRDGYLIHFNYIDSRHFIDKLNSYTGVEAGKIIKANINFNIFRIFYVITKEFLVRLIYLKGYKDGWIGIYLSMMMAFYRFCSHAKARELNETGDFNAIVKKYNIVAMNEIKKYD